MSLTCCLSVPFREKNFKLSTFLGGVAVELVIFSNCYLGKICDTEATCHRNGDGG